MSGPTCQRRKPITIAPTQRRITASTVSKFQARLRGMPEAMNSCGENPALRNLSRMADFSARRGSVGSRLLIELTKMRRSSILSFLSIGSTLAWPCDVPDLGDRRAADAGEARCGGFG